MKNEKRQMTKRIELANKEYQNSWRNENLQSLRNIRRGHTQTYRDERNSEKS